MQIVRLFTQIAFLLVLIATSASAQVKSDLEASDPYWGRSPVVSVRPHSFPVDRGQASNYPPTDEVSALFRNVGNKAVKSVTWKFIFYKDEERTDVLAAYTFSSGKRIEPGASVRLKESVSAFSEPKQWTNYQAVVISRVKYTDGTIWQAAESKKSLVSSR